MEQFSKASMEHFQERLEEVLSKDIAGDNSRGMCSEIIRGFLEGISGEVHDESTARNYEKKILELLFVHPCRSISKKF